MNTRHKLSNQAVAVPTEVANAVSVVSSLPSALLASITCDSLSRAAGTAIRAPPISQTHS
jgi:hypothetical protein